MKLIKLGTLIIIAFQIVFSSSINSQTAKEKETRIEKIARTVTIYRDKYGVPHVYGPTNASVIFGGMYVRAEEES